ncbi:phosphonoacetate hydrolase [Roseateles sp. YR242]|uniref:hypothetical protein n=1 Tax=Roseateles sp. YR242 TaxID=1855305 RepID=UPI0008B6B6A5|nr:hypothetical protein [Roseateles sp. YR242]SEK34202.1 phosphonoacetate hydrolase [Roseateles sp. YR242]
MSSRTSRPLTERAMRIAESRIPELAARSGHEAYKTTLSRTGAVVVKTSQGQMVERRADGTSTVIKHLPLGKRVTPGVILKRSK